MPRVSRWLSFHILTNGRCARLTIMAEQDDQHWMALLAGRPAEADAATRKEAAAVRAALLATHDELVDAKHDVEAGVQRLLFRLRREHLLDERPRRAPAFYWGMALAASLFLAIGVVTLQPDWLRFNDEAVYRGSAPQVLSDAEPAQRAEAIKADLEAANIAVQLTVFGDIATLSADWPARPNAAQLAVLKKQQLKRPAGGQLRIEIRPAAEQGRASK